MCHWRRVAPWILAVGAGLTAAACGESPTEPTPPPPQLVMTCPPPQTAASTTGQPVPVTWQAPTAQGGTPPIQIVCTPPSGSAFPVGTTYVGCTAASAAPNQSANCSFTVTVTRAPQLSVSRFMAFGDSITWGQDSRAGYVPYPIPAPSHSYPTQLQLILSARYAGQTFTVANEGWPAEMADVGLSRLPSALTKNTPEVVLLLHGANDLLNSPSNATTQYIAGKLRDMVKTAKTRVAPDRVLLALFPPQYHGTGPSDRGKGAEFVPELNQRIAAVAQGEGATLVDLYTPMNADVKRYIGQDGLHPTEAGFTLMAQTFAAVIQQKFEVKPTAR